MGNWLVTGANGFLGSNSRRILKSRGTVVGVSRSGKSDEHGLVQAVDLLNHHDLRRLIHEQRPDYVLHTAAVSSHEMCAKEPELAMQINVELTERLAEISAEVKAKFFYVSTDAVFDGEVGQYSETDSPNPFSRYGETKLMGEEAALQVNPDTTVVRTNFFGWSPSGERSILEFFVSNLQAGKEVFGYTNYVTSSIYVDSLVSYVYRLSQMNLQSSIFHVAARDSMSKYEFGCLVREVFSLPKGRVVPRHAPSSTDQVSRARDLSLSTDRLRDAVGEQAQSQREGLVEARDRFPKHHA